jgi:hypothetical protein
MTTLVQTEDNIAQTEDNQSRRSFLRAATLSAIAAIPAVAALSRAGAAHANPECVELTCACAGCFGGCTSGTFVCRAICWDLHTASCCGLYCPGDAPEVPGCGLAGTGCPFTSCGGSGC